MPEEPRNGNSLPWTPSDDSPVISDRREKPATPDRCGACGRFLRKDSLYTNRCSNCWTPEDEFRW
jgi:hypothetical protein